VTRTSTRSSPAGPAVDPRIRQRHAAVKRHVDRRRLAVVVAVVSVVVLAVAAVAVLHSPLLSVRRVEVVGPHAETPTAVIVRAAGIGGHPPLVDVDTASVAARVESLPFVRTARVTRSWPSTVRIAVTARVPALVMAVPGGGWAELDRAGRVLARVPARPAGLPLLTVHQVGGPLAPPVVGASVAGSARPGVEVAATLPPAFSAQVTVVTELPAQTVDLTLSSGLTVVLGTVADLHAKYVDVASIIAGAPLHGAKTIDVSVPQAPTVSDS
jgi:cell division protein FtsQ